MNAESLAARIGHQLGSTLLSDDRQPHRDKPPAIPDHEILGRIGQGSYGEVWLARSVTGILRAVKVIRRSAFSNDRPYEREFRGIVQFESVSRLHPHLICTLHVGRDDAAGLFYYVMELADDAATATNPAPGGSPGVQNTEPNPVSGDRLGSYIPRTLALDLKTRGHLPVAEVLRLGVQLADALGHLHRHGLVHRDVKPSNVIFVRGQPKLADIGLVAGKDETRSFVGTAGFVPPEGHGTERADLFSLGRLLYESASGKDRCEFPELPPDLDCWPADEREALLELSEVLVRACAIDASKRHANAADLAADLNLILSGRSVRRAYGIERRLRRARRVSAIALVVLAVTGGILGLQNHARRNAEVRASEEAILRQRAEVAEHEARRQLHTALLEQARANRISRELGQRVATLKAVRSAAAISNSPELRREAFGALALPDLMLAREVVFQPDQIASIVDPTFQRYATSRGVGAVELRSIDNRRLLASLEGSTNQEAHLLTWSPDGRFLGFKRDYDPGGIRADLEIWDTHTARRMLLASDAVTANALAFHPGRPEVIAGDGRGAVRIWDLERGREIHRLDLPSRAVAVDFAPGGELYAAVYYDQGASFIRVHDVAKDTTHSSHRVTNWLVRAVWHPEGRWLGVPDYSGNVRLIDTTSGEQRLIGQHKASAVDVAFTPEGDFMITGGWERELICWDLQTLQRALTIGINASHARFGVDGRHCVVYAPDRALIYEFQRSASHREFSESLGRWLVYASFSSDGRWLAASGDDYTAAWDLRSRGPAAILPGNRDRIPHFAPDSSEFYTYWGNGLHRWQVAEGLDGQPPAVFERPILAAPTVQGLGIVSNQLVMTCSDGIRVMPMGNTDPDQVRFLRKAGGWSTHSPDNRLIALRIPKLPVVRVYSLPDAERVAWVTNRAGVWNCAFSPKGDELVVATANGLEFYDVATWQRTRELAIACERQASILFAPDGETFWFTSDARTGSLRSTRSLAVLLPLPAGYLPIALSADGRQLAISVDMQRVQVWNLDDLEARFRDLGVHWEGRY
jgi:WD40 repeat protein